VREDGIKVVYVYCCTNQLVKECGDVLMRLKLNLEVVFSSVVIFGVAYISVGLYFNLTSSRRKSQASKEFEYAIFKQNPSP